LLVCLVAIPFFLEHDPGYAFGTAIRVILHIDLTQRTDGSLEKFLHRRIKVRAYLNTLGKFIEPSLGLHLRQPGDWIREFSQQIEEW
jgi:hypothetical protein